MGNTTEGTSNDKSSTSAGNNRPNWFKPEVLIPAITAIFVALIALGGEIYQTNRQAAGTNTAAATEVTSAAPTTAVPSIEIEPMVIATPPVCPAPRSLPIGREVIVATVTILQPNDDCSPVSRNETIDVGWSVKPADTYYLWIFVFSPITRQYYPRACDTIPLQAEGTRRCQVTFGGSEPYEIVIVLANRDAHTELGRHTDFSESNLPDGIEEKAALSVYRSP